MSRTGRYESVDALRGLIMILMAIDHASATIAREHAAEFWSGAMSIHTSAFGFLTRWITHLCAPGFFFLMGAGIAWYAAAQGQAAMRRTVLRGLVLFVVAQAVELPFMLLQSKLKGPAVSLSRVTAPPPNDGSEILWGFITLTGLGLVMIVCGLLLRLKPWAWLLVSVLCVWATHALLPADGKSGSWWMALLLAPGIANHIIAIYPVIPWLAVAAAGMYFAHWWRQNPERAASRVWMVGLALLLIGAGLRAAGGWGNIRPPRDNGWIEFLNNVKYPPSAVFWTMAVGIDLLLLALIQKLPAWVRGARSPLLVFGQTPLFFYITHFYLLLAFGFLLFQEPGSLQVTYVMWLVVLVLLYPVCAWYRGFKLAKPRESLWRMF